MFGFGWNFTKIADFGGFHSFARSSSIPSWSHRHSTPIFIEKPHFHPQTSLSPKNLIFIKKPHSHQKNSSKTPSKKPTWKHPPFSTPKLSPIEFALVPGRCGGTYRAARGHLATPNFPNYYPNNLDCNYDIIRNQESEIITLDFLSSSLQAPHFNAFDRAIDCKDHVQIFTRNSGNEWQEATARMCDTDRLQVV